MHARFLAAALVVVILATGCSDDDPGATSTSTTTPAAASTTSSASTTSRASSTPTSTTRPADTGKRPVDFRNFTFDVPTEHDSALGALDGITVADGTFTRDQADDRLYLEVRDVHWVDLDGDGTDEAAVWVSFDTGGTGHFSDLLVYRITGDTATFVTDDGVGDRADGGIDRVAVDGNAIRLARFAGGEGACCPTAIEERVVTLSGAKLVTRGTPSTYGVVDVTPQPDKPAPIEVKFRPGTSRAALRGDATTKTMLTLDANGGQRLTLTLDATETGSVPVKVALAGPDGATLGTATAGTGIDVKLPANAIYTLTATPTSKPSADQSAWLSADLRIDP